VASAVFDKARETFLSGGINASADNLKVVLVDNGAYTVNLATHQFLTDIPSGARIATSGNLSGKTVTAGTLDAADITIPTVSGASIESIVVYKDTGTAGTSNLICYIDAASSGLPLTPTGGDVTVVWSASGIFKL
jgi:hypothetical protein